MILKNKITNMVTWLVAAIGILVLLPGCGLIEPEDSELTENQLPNTIITSAPKQNSEYSYFVRVAWKGEDSDGLIVGFNLAVDNPNEWKSVTITDSTFRFEADTLASHTIWVAAVDNDGGVDDSPASVTFTAKNNAPETQIQVENDPRQGSTFGLAQDFTIVAIDIDNGPEFSYRYKIDDGAWSEWLDTPLIEFSETSRFGLFTPGAHTFYAQVRDAGMAVDPTPASFSFTASVDVLPQAVLNQSINSQPFYPDNSTFYFEGDSNYVRFSWEVDASSYFGRFAAAKFKLDDNPETGWMVIQDTLFAALTPGAHSFVLIVKDAGGVESQPISFSFNLVKPLLNSGILVVDDGDGRFAKEADVDKFYTDLLTSLGATFALWDIKTQGRPTPGYGFGNYSTIIWEADETFMSALPVQTRLAQEYLDAGGNMWITGWKPVQQISTVTPVNNFNPDAPGANPPYRFVWDYLKLQSSRQSPGTPPDFTGATGLAGHPSINVDEAKNFIPTFANKLALIDVFTVREGATAIYSFISSAANPDFQDAVVGMKYLGDDFKVVLFGFPLYHMKTDEATEAARKILTDLGEI